MARSTEEAVKELREQIAGELLKLTPNQLYTIRDIVRTLAKDNAKFYGGQKQ